MRCWYLICSDSRAPTACQCICTSISLRMVAPLFSFLCSSEGLFYQLHCCSWQKCVPTHVGSSLYLLMCFKTVNISHTDPHWHVRMCASQQAWTIFKISWLIYRVSSSSREISFMSEDSAGSVEEQPSLMTKLVPTQEHKLTTPQ